MASDRPYKEPKVKQLVKDWFDARQAFSWAPVSNGFGVHGIPDRVGCVPIVVTPEMVGKRIGVFVGLECKGSERLREKDGGLSAQQIMRLKEIAAAAGFAGAIYSPNDLTMADLWLTRLTSHKS
jgi:hypothetical protein